MNFLSLPLFCQSLQLRIMHVIPGFNLMLSSIKPFISLCVVFVLLGTYFPAESSSSWIPWNIITHLHISEFSNQGLFYHLLIALQGTSQDEVHPRYMEFLTCLSNLGHNLWVLSELEIWVYMEKKGVRAYWRCISEGVSWVVYTIVTSPGECHVLFVI